MSRPYRSYREERNERDSDIEGNIVSWIKTCLKIQDNPKKKDSSSTFIIPNLSPDGTCPRVNADTKTSGETTERDDGIETLKSYVNVMTERDVQKEENRIWWERFKKDVDFSVRSVCLPHGNFVGSPRVCLLVV
jgi:hypothetical protein